MDLNVLQDYNRKTKENEKRNKYLHLARELKISLGYEGKDDISCNWFSWNDSLSLGKKARRVGNWRTSRDH